MSARLWSIDLNTRKVPTLRTELMTSADRVNLLFLSDLHWDSNHSDRAALKRILDEAMRRDAVILLLGDVLDLMQGREDRRGSKGSLRPEHKVDAYFSAVVEDWVRWYEPYARNTWIALQGNHTSSVLKHQEIDVDRMWVGMLNAAGATIDYPGYSTYARILNQASTRRTNLRMFLHHGYGGGGPVTKGTIQASRRSAIYPDAHFLVTGHIHESWGVDHPQYRLDHDGKPYEMTQEHYSCGAWKGEFDDGKGGWWVEKGMGPRPKTGWWCELRYTSHFGLNYVFTKAKPEMIG